MDSEAIPNSHLKPVPPKSFKPYASAVKRDNDAILGSIDALTSHIAVIETSLPDFQRLDCVLTSIERSVSTLTREHESITTTLQQYLAKVNDDRPVDQSQTTNTLPIVDDNMAHIPQSLLERISALESQVKHIASVAKSNDSDASPTDDIPTNHPDDQRVNDVPLSPVEGGNSESDDWDSFITSVVSRKQ
jgi:hypothetical protein